MAKVAEGYGKVYAESLRMYTPYWIIPVLFIICFIGAYLGSLLGKSILKKHLKKAGIV